MRFKLKKCPFKCGKVPQYTHDEERHLVQIVCHCGPFISVTRHYGEELRLKTFEEAKREVKRIWNDRNDEPSQPSEDDHGTLL